MGKLNKIIKKLILVLIVLVIGNQVLVFSQAKKKRTFMYLTYVKSSDGIKNLKVKLKYKENKKFRDLENAQVFFFHGEDSQNELGTVVSNHLGEAVLKLEEEIEADSLGNYCFSAKFKGNENHKKATKELCVKDAEITMSFNQKPESRDIEIKAYEVSGDQKIAISNENVVISVPTLFGNLVLGKASVQEGECVIQFPSDLPGDEDGMLLITAKIAESEIYGEVNKTEKVPWGIKSTEFNEGVGSEKGKLWTYNAPIWMVVTLAVLLLGVWSHFGYVVFKMFKINKEGKALANVDKEAEKI